MSKLIQVSKSGKFALSNRYFSYVIGVNSAVILENIYYGPPVKEAIKLNPDPEPGGRGCVVEFANSGINLNARRLEFPGFGTSDFRVPAFHGRSSNGDSVFTLHYQSYRISKNKETLTELPSTRGGACETLIITLMDPIHKLEVELHYTIYEAFGVLVRSSRFKNDSDDDIELQHVFSTALDLPPSDYEILHLHGTWSRELNEERLDLPTGRFVIDSSRGTSSAAHNPFIALLEKGTSETNGRVYATALMYSGNFAINVEKGEFEHVRLLAGINPFGFQWPLKPGETFCTPEAMHVFTDKGLGSMSHIWHDFIREKISPPAFKGKPRPSYLNTWEAAYFDVDEDKVLKLADKAKNLGVEMLVLDDGWFEGRRDDTSSLGDWTADGERFPRGIPWLASNVKSKGLKFGIWFEPEMVSPNSHLFRAHPDWALNIPGRASSIGRNQLTLDLSRADVREYIFDSMDALLSCGDIDYVKWDMNRNMTEIRSAEHAHYYMIGLYNLLKRLTEKYPDILFENCASGGNRLDLGMLSFMPQAWISDMCDPIGRLAIVNGASYLFPMDVMAAYIGPSPNHQNGRLTSIQSRFMAGMFCVARGISLNERDLDENHSELKAFMDLVQKTAPDMVGGRFARLLNSKNEVCWQYTSPDGTSVYLVYFHTLSAPNQPLKRQRLVGLDPAAVYTLQDENKSYRGDVLLSHGVSLPYVSSLPVQSGMRQMPKGDFSSYLFLFTKD